MTHPCIEELRKDKAFAGIESKQLEDIVTFLDNNLYSTDYIKAANEFKQLSVMKEKRKSYTKKFDLIRKIEMKAQINTRLSAGENPMDIFEALAGGTFKADKYSGISYRGVQDTFKGQLKNLQRNIFKGKESLFQTSDNDLQLSQAMDTLSRGKSIESFPAHIREVAEGLTNLNKVILTRLQDAGIYIQSKHGYLWKQTHSPEKIMAVKKEVWIDYIINKLNHEYTFDKGATLETKRELLGEMYEEFTNTNYADVEGYYTGTRELIFKTPDDFVEYNNNYGRGSMLDTLNKTIDSAARHYANHMVLGSKPKQMIASMEQDVTAWLKQHGKNDELKKFNFESKRRRRLESAMFGYNDHPAKNILEKIVHASTYLQVVSKLGTAVLGTGTDIAFFNHFANQLTDKNFMVSHKNWLEGMKNTFKKEDLQAMAGRLGIIVDDQQASLLERMGVDSSYSGSLGTALDKLSSLTLLGWQGDRARTNSALTVSLAFGMHPDLSFKDLPPVQKQQFERFGILESEWEVLRNHLDDLSEQGYSGIKALTPEAVFSIPKEVLEKAAGKQVKSAGRYREELSAKIGNMLNRFSRDMSPNANDATRADMYWGEGAGTPLGAFLRMALQFQSYVFSLPRVLKTMAYLDPNNHGKSLGAAVLNMPTIRKLGIFGLQGTIFAAIGVQLKRMALSKETEDWTSPKLWTRAVSSGAMPFAAGYVFDVLTGEYASDYRDMPQRLFGPTLSAGFDAARLASVAAYHGWNEDNSQEEYKNRIMSPKAAKLKMIRTIRSNTPFVNMPIAKQAFDAAFYDALINYIKDGDTGKDELK